MGQARLTLLIERLEPLLAAASSGERYPALEVLLRRGRPLQQDFSDPDEVRFALFGVECRGSLPIGALTHIADRGSTTAGQSYWLRVDPVTLWADMARVIMTQCGFADLDEVERNDIECTVRQVLQQQGFDLHADHPERWTIALQQPLEFSFVPPHQALGMDAAEALPDHPQALFWRRLLNEVQMALHACPVNQRRRAAGREQINSVWFWGGGFMPSVSASGAYDRVYAHHPVSRGLALLQQAELFDLSQSDHADFGREGGRILVDWCLPPTGADAELRHLERFAQHLLAAVRSDGLALEIYAGNGRGWQFGRACLRRFWRRPRPLQAGDAGRPA